jgi:hypothetical protein
VNSVLAMVALAACGSSARAAWTAGASRAEGPGRWRRALLWSAVAALALGFCAEHAWHLSQLVWPLARHLLHLTGWSRHQALARAKVAALLLALTSAWAFLLGARGDRPLRAALALGLLLAALMAGAVLSFRARLMLEISAGGLRLREWIELGGLVVLTALALVAGSPRTEREGRRRLRTIWLGATGVMAVIGIGLSVAGTCAARGRLARLPTDRVGKGLSGAVGGGFTTAGLWGEYFDNPSLSGKPRFARRDVRIDFDWGPTGRPGGSTSPGFSAVGHDGFSVRWTGRVIVGVSEPFTFHLVGDDGARLYLRDKGSPRWRTIVDRWSSAGEAQSAPVPLTAGEAVELRLEYHQSSGPARIALGWSSPSTPREIIEPLGSTGVNVTTYLGYLGSALWADAMKGGRYTWTRPDGDTPVPLDEDGWPLGDADNITIEGATPTPGTYSFSFQGTAEVAAFPDVAFEVAGKRYEGLLPKGVGYDAPTNTTRATFQLGADRNILTLKFRHTQRKPSSPVGGGIRDVSLMRPSKPGSAESYAPGTLFAADLETFLSSFTVLRWILNFDKEADWSGRVRPFRAKALRDNDPPIWEHVIMLANETGRDLYLCTPVNATDDYLAKLARLIRFGSDERGEPLAGDSRRPAHPGLNPNLRLYLERSNEIWNWSFSQSQDNQHQAEVALAHGAADGRIVNYDGHTAPDRGGDLWLRWHALKTKQLSDTFRGVFGDAEMDRRVRVLYEYQYDDLQATASEGLTFLDHYFNNGDGQQHVANPRPPSAYLWGAGAATYYGSGDASGIERSAAIADAGFEADRRSSPWKLEGKSGLYRTPPVDDALALRAAGPVSAPAGALVGRRFSVADRPLAVYELGRLAGSGDKQPHAVFLVGAADRSLLASAEVQPAGGSDGRYSFAKLAHPVVLAAHTSYFLVSAESAGGDPVHAAPTADLAAALRAESPIVVREGNGYEPAGWHPEPAPAAWPGPTSFRFAIASPAEIDAPPTPAEGQQAAFIKGTGAIGATVDFGAGGLCGIEIRVAGGGASPDPLDFYLDDRRVTPHASGTDPRVNPDPFTGGRWAYDVHDLLPYASAPIKVSGVHRLRIVGRGNDQQTAYLDDAHVVCADVLFAGGMPAGGEANGQAGIDDYARQMAKQARYAQAFGLRPVGYEGGWSVGGDFNSTAIQSAAKYLDPRARSVNALAIAVVERAGYALSVLGTYDLWPTDFESGWNAPRYPLVQSVLAANDRLRAAPTNGQSVSSPVSLADAGWSWPNADHPQALESAGAFTAVNLLVPKTGRFDVRLETAGAGTLSVLGDGGLAFASAGAVGRPLSVAALPLSSGLHTITIRLVDGTASLRSLTVLPAESGAGPAPRHP